MTNLIITDISDTKNKHWIGKAVEVGVYRWERRTVIEGSFKGMVYYLRNGGSVVASKIDPAIKSALDGSLSADQKRGEWQV
jgi:hypothetical protein